MFVYSIYIQNSIGRQFSSKGKVPWMIYEGEEIADSHFCIETLKHTTGIDLNAHLTEEQKAVGWTIQAMVEDHLAK